MPKKLPYESQVTIQAPPVHMPFAGADFSVSRDLTGAELALTGESLNKAGQGLTDFMTRRKQYDDAMAVATAIAGIYPQLQQLSDTQPSVDDFQKQAKGLLDTATEGLPSMEAKKSFIANMDLHVGQFGARTAERLFKEDLQAKRALLDTNLQDLSRSISTAPTTDQATALETQGSALIDDAVKSGGVPIKLGPTLKQQFSRQIWQAMIERRIMDDPSGVAIDLWRATNKPDEDPYELAKHLAPHQLNALWQKAQLRIDQNLHREMTQERQWVRDLKDQKTQAFATLMAEIVEGGYQTGLARPNPLAIREKARLYDLEPAQMARLDRAIQADIGGQIKQYQPIIARTMGLPDNVQELMAKGAHVPGVEIGRYQEYLQVMNGFKNMVTGSDENGAMPVGIAGEIILNRIKAGLDPLTGKDTGKSPVYGTSERFPVTGFQGDPNRPEELQAYYLRIRSNDNISPWQKALVYSQIEARKKLLLYQQNQQETPKSWDKHPVKTRTKDIPPGEDKFGTAFGYFPPAEGGQ